ncbi:hypothetical protein U1Q18_047292 [Sarracenia purpurea var. burkii]
MDEYNDEPSLMHLLNICIVLSNAQSTLQHRVGSAVDSSRFLIIGNIPVSISSLGIRYKTRDDVQVPSQKGRATNDVLLVEMLASDLFLVRIVVTGGSFAGPKDRLQRMRLNDKSKRMLRFNPIQRCKNISWWSVDME